MLRRDLIDKLWKRPLPISEVAKIAEMPIREIEGELGHLLKSLKHTDYEATIYPAECRACGFVFEAKRLRKPSKCPKCHRTWISEPRIEIHEAT